MRWSKVGQGRVRQTRAGIGVRRVRVSLCNGGCFGLSCSIELFDMNIIDVKLQFCLSLSLLDLGFMAMSTVVDGQSGMTLESCVLCRTDSFKILPCCAVQQMYVPCSCVMQVRCFEEAIFRRTVLPHPC
jgi:hypothetical protein